MVISGIRTLLNAEQIRELQDHAVTVWQKEIIGGQWEFADTFTSDELYVYLSVEQGEAEVLINYKPYRLATNGFAVITPLHIVQPIHIGEEFRATALLARKSVRDVTPSMEKVFKQLNRSLKLYLSPVLQLDNPQSDRLRHDMEFVHKRLLQTEHSLQSEAIQNAFVAFLLDWIDIGDRYIALQPSDVEINRAERILQSFVQLLKTHYKAEHEIGFYAQQLSITPQHLNRIIRHMTGHTVSELIYELLFCAACIELNQSEDPVEQIAETLYFSDASAFCKFFKRRAGVTPLNFRKGSS